MLDSFSYVKRLHKKYDIPMEDIFLIGINLSGINANIPDKRIRFKFKFKNYEEMFYLAICVNTKETPFSMKGGKIYFDKQPIGTVIDREKDTCDSTYFRRNKTELTLNSNSRSKCKGCKFCGTYNQEAEDKNDLLTEDRLINHLNAVLKENNMRNLASLMRATVCTGCFNSEERTINHILMVRSILREQFGFKRTLRYIGSELTLNENLDIIKNKVSPFSLSLTAEVFTRRKQLLKNIKSKTTLGMAKEILKQSIQRGFETNMLYILGLDSLKTVIQKFKNFAPLMTAFPVINLFQNYLPQHETLRNPEAGDIEYYLKVRKELEKIFRDTYLRPRPWENYRGLWYLTFDREKINDIRI